MMLRVFTDRMGRAYQVWPVHPSSGEVRQALRAGWLCFEAVSGGQRYRLPIRGVPFGWEQLPDERLDLLLRVAAPSPARSASMSATEAAEIADEDAAQLRPPETHHPPG